MTWILKPDVDVRSLPAVTLAIGIALVDTAAALTGVQPDLRWPNDLLIGEKKCAGILVQAQTGAVLAGIGVNLNHEGFPHEIADLATSWRAESGRRFEREDVLIALEPRLREALALLETRGVSAVIEEFTRRSSYAQGKRVAVDQDGSTLTGTTAGLDDNGFLRLRQENGHETLILAGGVRPL
jgi:BirA family biotin operon repressor/biotin-[acetyl-CoA-carboxylase] ligase